MANVGAEPGRLKIFISYSRKDEDFAQDLLAGLQAAGFEPYLDKHDIAAAEDWEARLARQGRHRRRGVLGGAAGSPDGGRRYRCVCDFTRRGRFRALRMGG